MPTLCEIKRAAMPTHKPTQIAAQLVPSIRDLILPNRTKDILTVDNLTARLQAESRK